LSPMASGWIAPMRPGLIEIEDLCLKIRCRGVAAAADVCFPLEIQRFIVVRPRLHRLQEVRQ